MTKPLVEYYSKHGLHTSIDASLPLDTTFKNLTTLLDGIQNRAREHAKAAASSKI